MKIWAMNQITNEEKSDILSKHRHQYNGYQAMQPKIENTSPLYVQDFAKDKEGMVINNKGDVKTYMNFGINESVEEGMCSECGGMMYEGECSECGMKGYSNEEIEENIYDVRDINNKNEFDYTESEVEEQDISGVQGVYGDMKPAYDFDSEGPGLAGPYNIFGEESDEEIDFDEDEDLGEIDDDLRESFLRENKKIFEMMNRMKSFN
jgi:hypothetical protein